MKHQPSMRALRIRLRLTQAELAERTGISESTVSYVERGARPSLRVQRVLGAALHSDPEALWPTAEVGGDDR
jgi:transcriptional regulator with XRE-family HTH domain